MKRAAKSDITRLECLRREIAALSSISDTRVPQLVESADLLSDIWVVTELQPGISLSQYMRNYNNSQSVVQVKSLITQLFSGVAVMFNSGFAHLRICDETIFIDDTGQLTFRDFQHAYKYTTDNVDGIHACVDAKIGTDIYTAPEVFSDIRYNARKAVMWSCGDDACGNRRQGCARGPGRTLPQADRRGGPGRREISPRWSGTT